jgi:predicted Fe-Mo cluster-binding NifX family protein
MKKLFAVPTTNGELTLHFGHCEKFAIVETEDNKIIKEEFVVPPIHQPGVYPKYLADRGVHVIIAGGMGQKAQELFALNNIEVFVGIETDSPQKLVQHYLDENLQGGDNLCDH